MKFELGKAYPAKLKLSIGSPSSIVLIPYGYVNVPGTFEGIKTYAFGIGYSSWSVIALPYDRLLPLKTSPGFPKKAALKSLFSLQFIK